MSDERPSDKRPRPKYGELAPEGWNWQPPVSHAAPVASEPGSTQGRATGSASAGHATEKFAPPPPATSSPYGQPSTPPVRTRANPVDVTVTALLLFVGILLSASMIPALFDFNQILVQAAAMQGYGTFSPTSEAQLGGVVAGVATIVLQLASIVISVTRLRKYKLAFPVPILFGIVTFAVWTAAIAYAFFSDPAFVTGIMSTPPTP